MKKATPYSFYPVMDDEESGEHSYANGYLFERRRRTAQIANTGNTLASSTSAKESYVQCSTASCTTSSSTTTATTTSRTCTTPANIFLPTNLAFCHCGNCATLPSTIERKCCVDETFDLTNFQDNDFTASQRQCVLNSKLLTNDVIGTVALQLQWFRQQRYKGLRGDELLFKNMTNKQYRYHAYRNYIDFIHGYLGKACRKVIPACVVTHIRRRWPDSDGNYVGYKAADNEEDTDNQPGADELEQFVMDGGN